MKRIILLLLPLLILSACDEEDLRVSAEQLKQNRGIAAQVIASRDFSTQGLLDAHEYFFDFYEKVEMMKSDGVWLKGFQSYAKSSGIASLCRDFLLERGLWNNLDKFCRTGGVYRCSIEMMNFPQLVKDFKLLLGKDFEAQVAAEPACRF